VLQKEALLKAKFEEAGCICKGRSPRKWQVPEGQAEAVRAAFIHSPDKSASQSVEYTTLNSAHKILVFFSLLNYF